MNRLSTAKRTAVDAALVEGNSIRSTVRMTGVAMNTILKLLAELGLACAQYQDETLRGLKCRRIQCDEVWQFCYAKAKNVPAEKRDQFGYGDVWTWIALDADTKLVPSWLVSTRDAGAAWRGLYIDGRGEPSREPRSTDNRWTSPVSQCRRGRLRR